MTIYEGKAVFEGVAIGKLSVYKKQEQSVKRVKIEDSEAEKKRYEDARNTAIDQLKGLYEKAVKEVGESGAEIFEAHQLMVDDEDFIESVENIIETENDPNTMDGIRYKDFYNDEPIVMHKRMSRYIG